MLTEPQTRSLKALENQLEKISAFEKTVRSVKLSAEIAGCGALCIPTSHIFDSLRNYEASLRDEICRLKQLEEEPPKMKKAIIFDIDGTLADISHRVHHIESPTGKDWSAFYQEMGDDAPIEPMADLLRSIDRSEFVIVFCTGRPASYREMTWNWLNDHCLADYGHFGEKLYMRKDGDFRPDTTIKREMLDMMREDGLDPVLAFEDRKRVVDMWREEGIICLQCAEGDY